MGKNNKSSSSSSVCSKIRQTLAPKHVTTGSDSPSYSHPSNTSTSVQTKPAHQNNAHTEESSGAIPIKFDDSTPTSSVAKGGSTSTLVKISERATKGGATSGHWGVHKEQQGNKEPMDINDTFKEFIVRAKNRMIRTMSTIGRSQIISNTTAAAPDHHDHHHEVHHHGATKNENHHEDPFKDFIVRAKKKIRATTMVRKTGSLRRE